MRSAIKAAALPVLNLALALLATSGIAQNESDKQQAPYLLKENVHLVVVPVTVKDHKGSLIDDLAQSDFRIFEDGRERPVKFFSNELTPLSAVVLLDTGMPGPSLAQVRGTLASLANTFGPEDEEALYLFDNTIRLAQDFTSQADFLAEAIKKARLQSAGPAVVGGPLGSPTIINGVPIDRPGTMPNAPPPNVTKRLRDAIYTAAERLKTKPTGRRRVVLVISDGLNGSDNTFSYDQLMEALLVSDVSVYAITLGSARGLKRTDLLARVTRETGGDIAYVRRHAGLDAAYFRLAGESRNSYVLGFPPASSDGRFHQIRVRVDRPHVQLTARNRFFAPPLK